MKKYGPIGAGNLGFGLYLPYVPRGLMRAHPEMQKLNRCGSRTRVGAKNRPQAVSRRARGRKNARRHVLCAPAQTALS